MSEPLSSTSHLRPQHPSNPAGLGLTTGLIDRYCSGWNEPDPIARLSLMQELWDRSITYTDPTVRVTRVQDLVDHIQQVRERRPGANWQRTSAVDAHHDVARFEFDVTQSDGTLILAGLDMAQFAADGSRLTRITGFFNS